MYLYKLLCLLIPVNLTLVLSFLAYNLSPYYDHKFSSFFFLFHVLKNNAFIPSHPGHGGPPK